MSPVRSAKALAVPGYAPMRRSRDTVERRTQRLPVRSRDFAFAARPRAGKVIPALPPTAPALREFGSIPEAEVPAAPSAQRVLPTPPQAALIRTW